MNLSDELLERFTPGCLEPDFGRTFLPRFCKHGAGLGSAELARYGLDADLKLNGSNYGLRFRHKYYDTTFNLCLTHDRALIASLGFEVDDAAMNVWQIQGVRGAGPRLAPLKWQRALLTYAVDWARTHAFAEVYVPSVERVRWATQEAHLDPAHGKLVYDVTARRCGFHRTDDDYYQLVL